MDICCRLGGGLPREPLAKLQAAVEANEDVLVMENAVTLWGLIGDCHSSANYYPHRVAFFAPIYKDTLQVLPWFTKSLHAGGYFCHTYFKDMRAPRLGNGNVDAYYYYRVARQISNPDGYTRLVIIGNVSPLLITEIYTKGALINRYYRDGFSQWILYASDPIIPDATKTL